MPTGLKSLFQPTTFEARGVAAPFTSPLMQASRVKRDERHGLTLIMPNMGGGQGNYVVPWASVPDFVTMTVFDRQLHDEIRAAQALTPDAMRTAALKVALSGLSGPEAAEAAGRDLAADEEQYVATHFFLMLHLLKAVGIDSRDMLMLPAGNEAWQQMAKAMLDRAGAALGIEIAALYERLGIVARLLSPVGVEASQQKGRMRLLFDHLIAFRDEIRLWSAADRSDAAEWGLEASDTAALTIDIAAGVLETIGRMSAGVAGLIRDWPNGAQAARDAVSRLSWLLDGWDTVLAIWAVVEAGAAEEKREAMERIKAALPLIPTDQIQADDGDTGFAVRTRRQRVKARVDWRTGKLDDELAARVSEMNRKALEAPALRGSTRSRQVGSRIAADSEAAALDIEQVAAAETIRLRASAMLQQEPDARIKELGLQFLKSVTAGADV